MARRAALLAVAVIGAACKPRSEEPAPPVPAPILPAASAAPVPQAMPLDDFDASLEPLDGKTPFEQARIYESRGQLWMAQMAIEKKALGRTGTKAEAEFLGRVCHRREDDACVAACEAKLGHRLKIDGGPARSSTDVQEHREPETELARARNAVLREEWGAARALLQPKLLAGNASKEEIRLLKKVCKHEEDRLCVALCDAKLR